MNVTTKDIAVRCGVSKGTVDRAINNRTGVNEQTRELILRTAREMGYRPHYLATSLVTGKTKSIGVVVFDLHNAFFAQLLDSISHKAEEFGYFTYITLTDKNPQQEIECIDHLVNGRVDGLIICPIHHGTQYIDYLKKTSIPVVTVMNTLDDPSFSHSDIDTREAMYDATKYVLSRGYDRVIYYSPPLEHEGKTNITSQKKRLLGHLDAMSSAGSGVESIVIPKTGVAEVMKAVQERNGKKTVVMCSSDVFALDLMEQFKLKGMKIPYDVGVMGFDNITSLCYMEPKLTTVSVPIKTVGEQAVLQLLEQINGDHQKTRMMYAEYAIVAGQTVI